MGRSRQSSRLSCCGVSGASQLIFSERGGTGTLGTRLGALAEGSCQACHYGVVPLTPLSLIWGGSWTRDAGLEKLRARRSLDGRCVPSRPTISDTGRIGDARCRAQAATGASLFGWTRGVSSTRRIFTLVPPLPSVFGWFLLSVDRMQQYEAREAWEPTSTPTGTPGGGTMVGRC